MKIPEIAKIVYRQMPAPQDLPQQIPASREKARMQEPQSGAHFWCKSPGVRDGMPGGWLWQKLIAALARGPAGAVKISNLHPQASKLDM